MGWSLSRLQPKEPELVNAALLAAGKALYLANAFESKCRFVLHAAQLVSYMEAHPGDSLPDAIVSLSKDKVLGPTIKELSLFPVVKPHQVPILEKARDARNFIAHEGAAFGYIFYVKERQIHEHLAKLRIAVADLAQGDNVVSRWVYEIEEKERAPESFSNSYVSMVDAWIFGRLEDVGR